ncbi:hypothetical protein FH972_000857 [Carpinus fangiana]|uniref:Uncharacterized protein n=1 Tax=Carpinus fangiana TaxID=176857 RepID=A0A5N6QBT7_9ROSI|nr:hypothetical protein FH972_000857 [Carpinus fangiana]
MATQNFFKRASIMPIMAKFDCMMKWLAWSMKSHSTVVKNMPLREQIPAASRKLDDHHHLSRALCAGRAPTIDHIHVALMPRFSLMNGLLGGRASIGHCP